MRNRWKQSEDRVVAQVEEIADQEVAGWIYFNDDPISGDPLAQAILKRSKCVNLIGVNGDFDWKLSPAKNIFIYEKVLQETANFCWPTNLLVVTGCFLSSYGCMKKCMGGSTHIRLIGERRDCETMQKVMGFSKVVDGRMVGKYLISQ
jgi:hypothetical protein